MEFTRKNYGYKQCNLDSKLTTKTSQTDGWCDDRCDASQTCQDKSTSPTVRTKLTIELKSTSAGKIFHVLTMRSLKNVERTVV